jgi:hypothetical protein
MAKEEKRKHTRIDSLNLSYFCLDENNQMIKQGMGRTLNVSESGILLETHFPIDEKHTITLAIGLEEDMVEISGRPVHSHINQDGQYEIGIEFLKTNEKARTILKQFIDAFQVKST